MLSERTTEPSADSKAGTLPKGNLARKAASLLDWPKVKEGVSSSRPLYLAAMRALKARGLLGYE